MKKAEKYAQNKIDGYSKYESALRAGYTHSTARNPSSIEKTKIYQSFWLDLNREMDLQGITLTCLAEKLKNALEAKSSTFYRGKELIGTQPNYKVQLEAIKLCLKLKYKAEDLQFNKRKIVEVNAVKDVKKMTDNELNEYLTSLCN